MDLHAYIGPYKLQSEREVNLFYKKIKKNTLRKG